MKTVDEAVEAILTDDGLLVGVAQKPSGGGWVDGRGTSGFVAYVMLTPDVGVTDGPLATPDSEVDRDYYVTCVAATYQGCQILADRVAGLLAGARVITPTRTTTGPITIERWGRIDRDETVQPHVFTCVHIARVNTVPI